MSQQIARGNQETTTTRKDLDLRDKELIKKSQNRCKRFRSKTSTGNSAKVRFNIQHLVAAAYILFQHKKFKYPLPLSDNKVVQ